MTEISKEAVDALLQGVTEGPWHVGRGDGQWFVGGGGFARVDMTGPLGDHEANALFIAAARELVPAQSDKIEAQAVEITALRAALDEAEARANDAETFLDNAISKAPEPLTSLGGWLANLLDEDDWPTAERYLNAAVVAAVKAEAERDAANALLRDGLLSVQTWRSEPIVNWAETVAAHLGAKP